MTFVAMTEASSGQPTRISPQALQRLRAVVVQETSLAPDSRLGKYHIRGELGRGGMAIVYLAQDSTLDRPVALKVLSQELTKDRSFILRLEREARAAARIDHPNIVSVYEVGRQADLHYLALQYIEGTTLDRKLAEKKRLPNAEAVEILSEVLVGLEAAHRAGILHRDLKPSNILIGRDGRVKITDFGLAKEIHPKAEDPTLTVATTLLGTPLYMSPEQIEGRSPTAASDIYSLGVVLYEILTGVNPFYAESITQILSKHFRGKVPPPSQQNPEIPEKLSAIVLKMMAPQLEDRYQSARECLEELRAFLPQSRQVLLPKKPFHPGFASSLREIAMTAGAIGALLAIVFLARWVSDMGKGAPAPSPGTSPGPTAVSVTPEIEQALDRASRAFEDGLIAAFVQEYKAITAKFPDPDQAPSQVTELVDQWEDLQELQKELQDLVKSWPAVSLSETPLETAVKLDFQDPSQCAHLALAGKSGGGPATGSLRLVKNAGLELQGATAWFSPLSWQRCEAQVRARWDKAVEYEIWFDCAAKGEGTDVAQGTASSLVRVTVKTAQQDPKDKSRKVKIGIWQSAPPVLSRSEGSKVEGSKVEGPTQEKSSHEQNLSELSVEQDYTFPRTARWFTIRAQMLPDQIKVRAAGKKTLSAAIAPHGAVRIAVASAPSQKVRFKQLVVRGIVDRAWLESKIAWETLMAEEAARGSSGPSPELEKILSEQKGLTVKALSDRGGQPKLEFEQGEKEGEFELTRLQSPVVLVLKGTLLAGEGRFAISTGGPELRWRPEGPELWHGSILPYPVAPTRTSSRTPKGGSPEGPPDAEAPPPASAEASAGKQPKEFEFRWEVHSSEIFLRQDGRLIAWWPLGAVETADSSTAALRCKLAPGTRVELTDLRLIVPEESP